MFHSFQTSIAGIELPRLFTYPFHYTPHPLCVMAAGEVQAYMERRIGQRKNVRRIDSPYF